MRQYIEVHCHSYYSLFDGINSPASIVKKAKSFNAPAAAITDHGSIAGIYEHYWACKKEGITPLIGCEFYIIHDLEEKNNNRRYHHVIVLAMNQAGYKNLVKLSSLSYRPDHHWHKPRISYKDLLNAQEGLLVTSACAGGVIDTASKDRLPEEVIERTLIELNTVFKDRFYLEIMVHKLDKEWDRETKTFVDRPICLQEVHNKRVLGYAEKLGIPLILASDAHMTEAKRKPIQDVMVQSTTKDGFHFYFCDYMMTSDEAWALCQANHPYISLEVFEKAIDNTWEIYEKCKGLELKFNVQVPRFPIEKHPLYTSEIKNSRDLMMAVIKDVGRMKWDDPEYLARFKEEIAVVCNNGMIDYTDYFLTLSYIASYVHGLGGDLFSEEYLKKSGYGMGVARGSGGGCIIAFLLGITGLDPILWSKKLGIPITFSRFLNEGRLGKPAISFGEYLFEKFGEDIK